MKVTKSCVRAAAIAVSLGCATGNVSAQAQEKSTEGDKPAVIVTDDVKGGDDGNGARRVIVVQGQSGKLNIAKEGQAADDTHTIEVRMTADQPKIWIGIGLKEVSGDLADYLGSTDGVIIESIYPDSPASKAALKEGDILLSVNGDKVAGPNALLEKLKVLAKDFNAEKADEIAALKFKVLRHGETLEVEVKPGPRPEHTLAQRDVLKEMPANVADFLKQIEKDGQVKILRIGTPTDISVEAVVSPDGEGEKKVATVENSVFVLQEGDKKTEVQVQKSGDGKAKITVKEGDKTRELSEEQVSELPAKVQEMVKNALSQKAVKLRWHAAGAQAQAHAQAQAAEAHKAAAKAHMLIDEQVKKAMEAVGQKLNGNVIIMGPDGEIKSDVIIKDMAAMAEKLKADAQAAGQKATETVKIYAGVPGQVEELRKEIDTLRKEISELKAQIDKEKSSASEKK